MTIQSTYSNYPGQGYAGQIARANEAYALDRGAAGEAVKAGAGVIYDGTSAVKPTSAAEQLLVNAVVSYDVGVVASGAIEYAEGDILKLAVGGVFYLTAGETLVYGDTLVYDYADDDWVKAPAVTVDDVTSQPKLLVTVVTGGASGDLIEARIHGQIRA